MVKQKRKKLKTWVIVLLILILIIILGIFINFNSKMTRNNQIGHNSSSQEIVDYILNINSYESKIEVEIQSNKNSNKYIIKQIYNQEEEIQEILEPSNIAGVKLIKNGNTLKLENSKLNLTSIFEDYKYVADNSLDLSSFIKDYKENQKSTWEEKDGIIKMITESNDNLKMQKILYINREDGKLQKMEIKDTNQKTIVYILYNEVIVNNKD